MSTATKIKGCTCVELINEKLKPFNTALHLAVTMGGGPDLKLSRTLVIETHKIESKKRGTRKTVFPTYCPFCGQKL